MAVLTSTGITFSDATSQTTRAATTADTQTFDVSGTWTKPTGGQTMARIQVWGGGGGAGRGTAVNRMGGGGGGGYNETIVPLSTLGATVTVTVGAGGTGRTGSTGAGTAGGTSSFGSTCLSYGGGGGEGFSISGTTSTSGGGGGPISAGSGNTPGGPKYSLFNASTTGCPSSGVVGQTLTIFHGGQSESGVRVDVLYGGGNGYTGTGGSGTSIYGGNGGAVNTVGTVPGGGGGISSAANGNGSNGATGRIVVTSW